MSQTEEDVVQRVAAILVQESTGGGTRDVTTIRVNDLENEVFGLTDRISRCVAESLLQAQADGLGEKIRCPCCHGELVKKPPRSKTLLLRRGEAHWEGPVWRCLPCRRDFFPQSAAMGCAVEAECSPAVEAKVVSASTRNRSYAQASDDLEDLAELEISAKRCARITQRIGQQRLGEREARSAEFDARTLPEQKRGVPADAPANRWDGRVAGVIVDGGRMQIRDSRWGTPKGPGERHSWWREPKIACVTTFQSRESAQDPLPEVPACLLEPLFVIPRVLGMKRTRAGTGSEEKPSPASGGIASVSPPSQPERWSPPPLVQSVVGTLGSYEDLGRLAEIEAWHHGFAAAPRKVFLGDALPANWRMQHPKPNTVQLRAPIKTRLSLQNVRSPSLGERLRFC